MTISQRLSVTRVGQVVLSAALAVSLYIAVPVLRGPTYRLALEINSSVPSTSQLFYNTGEGFTEAESGSAPVNATAPASYEHLSYSLPRKSIIALRFDPVTTEGTITVRKVEIEGPSGIVIHIDPDQIIALNQIKSRTRNGAEVTFVTTPMATDPGIFIGLSGPFQYEWTISGPMLRSAISRISVVFGVGLALYLLLDIFLLKLRKTFVLWVTGTLKHVNETIGQLAVRLSEPDFIVFDKWSLWFYCSCLMFFFVMAIADLNGSSIAIYARTMNQGGLDPVVAGVPRPIRQDEFLFHTPAILNEYLKPQHFAIQHSSVGDHSVSLLANVPVIHASTLFRPQFWPFFVLPLDYAFAFYWQCKALILLTGSFTWLLLITQSSRWATVGALWYFFSPFTQWTYSWPSLLPEMVGLICLCMVSFCYLTVGRNRKRLAFAALVLSSSAINFALCAYIPHLLPLFWLGVFFAAGWVIASRHDIFTSDQRFFRAGALVAAVSVIALVGLNIYHDVRAAIVAISNTAYPGRRSLPGGIMPLPLLISHFLQWTENDRHSTPGFNICESMGFLWLAPATLFCLSRFRVSLPQKIVLVTLWCFNLLVFAWLVFPIPLGFGQLFGLDRTFYTRCVPALGLTNIAIVAICMASQQNKPDSWRSAFLLGSLSRIVGILGILLYLLMLSNKMLASYYNWKEIFLAAIIATILLELMITRRAAILAICLIVPQMLLYGLVNPIEKGLGTITKSALFKLVQDEPEMRQKKWLVYSESPLISGLMIAVGCDVYTGLHYLPDIDHFPLFSSKKLSVQTLNRDGFLLARPREPGSTPSLDLVNEGIVVLNVSPSDPLLKQLGIGYVAFDRPPPPAVISTLIPIRTKPVNNVWLYRIP